MTFRVRDARKFGALSAQEISIAIGFSHMDRRQAENFERRHTDFRSFILDHDQEELSRLIEVFFGKIDIRGRDECWPWMGARGPRGYGSFGTPAGTYVASRVALELARRCPLPFRTFACHRCDNPPCCNGAHLFAGTARENTLDMQLKDRGRAALTNAEVIKIRLRYSHGNSTIAGLAREYGVVSQAIRDVLDRRTFRHVKTTRENRAAWLKRDLEDFLKSRPHKPPGRPRAPKDVAD